MADSLFEDSERSRRQLKDIQDSATRSQSIAGGASGSLVAVVVTSSGPAAPGYFKCEIQTVTGAEVEGGGGTLTGTGLYVQVMNVGSAILTTGTKVICNRVPHRWVFRYD